MIQQFLLDLNSMLEFHIICPIRLETKPYYFCSLKPGGNAGSHRPSWSAFLSFSLIYMCTTKPNPQTWIASHSAESSPPDFIQTCHLLNEFLIASATINVNTTLRLRIKRHEIRENYKRYSSDNSIHCIDCLLIEHQHCTDHCLSI